MIEDSPKHALPILSQRPTPAPSTRDSRFRVAAVLTARWLLIGTLIAALHVAARQRGDSVLTTQFEIPQSTLRQWFGESAAEAIPNGATQQATVVDGDGQFLGRVMQTLPIAESVTGYRGSSNLMIGVDLEETIVGVQLISSEDTVDHVRSIERSEPFFSQFRGKSTDARFFDFDGVSGATLTSLAMVESVAVRLGNRVPESIRFPDPISYHECEQVFPAVAHGKPHPDIPGAIAVVDQADKPLGTLVRTGPLTDDLHGYQGPSELLLGFDRDEKLMHVSVRDSFDNEPHTSYVDDEPWYWDPFLGKTVLQLASSDLQTLGIEGVSGATMSTMAAAETLIEAANVLVRQRADAGGEVDHGGRRVRWTWKDSGTVVVLLGSLGMSFGRFRSKQKVRWVWQAFAIVILGFVTGNLLSIALLLGWGTSGVPWHLAPGLAGVVLFAFAVPLLTKSPVYCTQLCPHGALQQWLRRRQRPAWTIPTRMNRCLLAIPGLLCIAAYWVALTGLPVNLASWEPFDAYIVWIGISGSLVVAVISLGLAAITPMGYCRFACPTGRVLSYTRRHARSGRWMFSDWAVVLLAASAWGWIFWQGTNVL